LTKKKLAGEAFEFLSDIYGQLKVSPCGYMQMTCESYLNSHSQHNHEEINNIVSESKIYFVGSLVDRWNSISKKLDTN